ncbi:hypothetical protein F8568_004865 [Actinomadura sp. LD22]|uniref:Uncharacterized protein n=1 Tax=Actinomadura physcomitrii TaxID=2650748 RepID=A0A6I4M6D5_9ACTN|nr:hypothetical protein [Actinomadura physcomitrii]MVZ99716.1 hypothetical protein [Actinomadura physcomitrii]
MSSREGSLDDPARHGRIPAHRRRGVRRARRPGSEETVAAEVRRYVDAGATEVVLTQTGLTGPADQSRTWQVLGGLARASASATAR